MMQSETLTGAHRDADVMLEALAVTTERLTVLRITLEEELAGIRDSYGARLFCLKKVLEGQKSLLEKHMKKHRRALFGTAAKIPGREDICTLPNGKLLRSVQLHLKKARGVLERLEAENLDEGIRIEKSVDWEALETWPDEKLIRVGTSREKKETFSYELAVRGGGDGAAETQAEAE